MQPGDLVAERFEIEARAGAGGMAEIWRAFDRHAGIRVALKVLRDEDDPGAARLAREAVILSELVHPGIVRYLAHGEAPSLGLYLAMEWLEGEDLAQRLARGGLTVEESVAMASRVAGALEFAHARGVVHRDIKP